MKCEICHDNDAKVAIHVTVGGRDKELYVCRGCAEAEKRRRRQPLRRRFGNLPLGDNDDYAPDYMDDGMDSQEGGRHWTLSEDAKPCPECGTTLEDLERSGLLGCPHCYTAFKDYLSRSIGLRGTFAGKIPLRGSRGKPGSRNGESA